MADHEPATETEVVKDDAEPLGFKGSYTHGRAGPVIQPSLIQVPVAEGLDPRMGE